tara:strand:- start:470 stop:1258 length:789 start_codon:yes stop_codon:yes gene_type:complete
MSHKIPKILIIAGSDSGGGAGIQADIKAVTFFKGFAMTAVTAITAQNTLGVQSILNLPKELVEQQIKSIIDDLPPEVIKIGMLGSSEIVDVVNRNIFASKVVLDPVMVATSGDKLINQDTIDNLIEKLIPKSFLVTPNLFEAEIIVGKSITSVNEQIDAAKVIKKMGAKNVLIKGGHMKELPKITDVLICDNNKEHKFVNNRIRSKNTHGTGCSLASAIACQIGNGFDVSESTKTAIDYVYNGIMNAPDFGAGNGPILHFDA